MYTRANDLQRASDAEPVPPQRLNRYSFLLDRDWGAEFAY